MPYHSNNISFAAPECSCTQKRAQFKIAIQHDDYGPGDSAAPRWKALLEEAGHVVHGVDVYRADILDQLSGCDAFMWRHAHLPNMRQIARRLLPVIEHEMGMTVYPDQRTCWHYDDKITQSYLLRVKGIPIPETWVWFDRKAAVAWAQNAHYPLVLKLWSGAGSENVRLVRSSAEAEEWIIRLFGRGVRSLADTISLKYPFGRTRLRIAGRFLLNGILQRRNENEHDWELHKNYVLFQEFLEGNQFDTRITVIGNRAFGFRRFNRDGDFRASGSGKIDWDPGMIHPGFIRLAFRVAKALGTQSCAIDGLFRGNELLAGEISYTYVSWAVQACPGHWELAGSPENGELVWDDGKMWPEEAQVRDFLQALAGRRGQLS